MSEESRPVGRLELWSVYRANNGIYKNVLVAMKYVPKQALSLVQFRTKVEQCLCEKILEEHPLLSCIVQDGKTDRPLFKRVQFDAMPIEVVEDCLDIEDFFRSEHERGPTNDRLWRVTLVPDKSAFWVSFAFHHGIGDGTSGLIFHEQLLTALQQLDDTTTLSSAIRRELPPSLEHSGLALPRPWKMLARELVRKLPLPSSLQSYFTDADFYGGRKTTLQDRVNRRTYMKTFLQSPAQVASLRTIAKANKISIHALLHGAAVHSIRTELAIKTSTPINLRPLLPNPEGRVVANYACAHASSSPRSTNVLATARAYYAELNTVQARRDAQANIGVLQYIDNSPNAQGRPGMEQLILDKLNTTRDHCLNYTLEISNLGNWVPPAVSDWRIEHVHFSGCNSGIGELFCVGVATVAGGLMNITCTATESYIDIKEVDLFMQTFEETLAGLA